MEPVAACAMWLDSWGCVAVVSDFACRFAPRSSELLLLSAVAARVDGRSQASYLVRSHVRLPTMLPV